MEKEVTVRGLNKEFAKELFSSKLFWIGMIIYLVGVILWLSEIYSLLIDGVIMLIAAIIMLNADYRGRAQVVKRLRWKK